MQNHCVKKYYNFIFNYIKMKIKDIIDNFMQKLNIKLNNINNIMLEKCTKFYYKYI